MFVQDSWGLQRTEAKGAAASLESDSSGKLSCLLGSLWSRPACLGASLSLMTTSRLVGTLMAYKGSWRDSLLSELLCLWEHSEARWGK